MGLLDDAAESLKRERADADALAEFFRRHPGVEPKPLSADPPKFPEYEEVAHDLLARAKTWTCWVLQGPDGLFYESSTVQRDGQPSRGYSLYVGEEYEGGSTSLLLVLTPDGRLLHRGHWGGSPSTFAHYAAQALERDVPKPPKRTGWRAMILGPD